MSPVVHCADDDLASKTELLRPTFLGIGSMRCGSTWLYEALRRRPDIHMATPKQLQFFNKHMLRKSLPWYLNHFATDDATHVPPVRGEITPFYARLSDRSVECVQQLLPSIQVVLTIRNPVDRVWSHLLYDWGLCKKRDLQRMSTLKLMDFLHRQRTNRYTDYETIIRRWCRHFGTDAVFVGLFDRIANDAEAFICEVLEHIGADPHLSDEPRRTLREPVYAIHDLLKQRIDMPESICWALSNQWLEPMERLNDNLDGMVTHWVDELRVASQSARPSWRAMRAASRYVTSLPERIGYAIYDAATECKLRRRWSEILSDGAANVD